MFRTEIDTARDRLQVELAASTQPGIEAKTTSGQAHGRSGAQSSDQLLKLSSSGLPNLVTPVADGKSGRGADS